MCARMVSSVVVEVRCGFCTVHVRMVCVSRKWSVNVPNLKVFQKSRGQVVVPTYDLPPVRPTGTSSVLSDSDLKYSLEPSHKSFDISNGNI